MSGTRAITLSLNVQGAAEVKRALEQLGPSGEAALRRLEDASKRAADRGRGLGLVGTSANEATRALEAMGSRLGPLGAGLSSIGVGGAAAAAAVASIGVGLVATARAGDQMVASLARLNTATGSIQAAAEVYDQLYRLSLQTGVAINESAGAFQRFSIAAREIGATRDQVFSIVQLMQQAGAVAGASSVEIGNASIQLSQGLASGRLQAEELNSIVDAMPNVVAALARELGVSVGEMRKLSSEGQLTADRVMPALLRAGVQINEEFGKLPPTMARGFEVLGNATNRFLADLDSALGLSNAIARALTGAAGAIDGARGALFPGAAQQAQNRVGVAQGSLADINRREAESIASGRRGNPAAFQRQRETALAELERAQIAALAIEQEGDLARFNEGQAAGERRLANQNRQLDQGLAALRGAYDRRTGVEETYQRAVAAIQTQTTRGAIDAAEAQRLTAAAERERAESLRRLADAAPPAAAGMRQVRDATVGEDRDFQRAEDLARRAATATLREGERARAAVLRDDQRANDAREREAEQSAQNISRYLADGFTDAFVSGERGFSGMLQSLQRTALATPIRIAAEAIVTPVAKSLTGALSGAGGEGGIASLFGLTQAGSNISSMLGLSGGAGGGISGLLNTPLGASFGSSATIGSAIGGVGGGFALGSLIGGFTAGDSRARQQNSQIGAAGGAAAGALIGSIVPGVGTVIGGLVGGALGGGGGGLIGPGRGFSGGDALIGVNDNGGLNVVGYAGKNFDDSAQLLQAAQQEVAALNATLAAAGLRFAAGQGGSDPGAFAAAIGGGESGNPTDLLGALNRFGVGGLRSNDARVQGALDRSGVTGIEATIAAASEAAQFAAQIDGIAHAAKDAEDPIGAIRRAYEAQLAIAERLGFGYDTLAAAQNKAIEAVEKQTNAEKEATRAREEATRAQEQRSRLNTATGFIEDVTFGGLSGNRTAAQRSGAALLALQSAQGAVRDGATQEELDNLRRIASAALPVLQSTGGLTESFGAIQRELLETFRQAVPGSDTAGLASVVSATRSIGDQIADEIAVFGNAQLIEQRALLEEMKRLAVSFSAIAARAA